MRFNADLAAQHQGPSLVFRGALTSSASSESSAASSAGAIEWLDARRAHRRRGKHAFAHTTPGPGLFAGRSLGSPCVDELENTAFRETDAALVQVDCSNQTPAGKGACCVASLAL